MKVLSDRIMMAVDAVALYCLLLSGLLAYGVCTQVEAAQITLLFLCLVAGFGTDHWRTRKLNNRILNPYHNGRK